MQQSRSKLSDFQPGLDLFVGLCLPAGAGVEPFALPQARLLTLPALTQAGVGV